MGCRLFEKRRRLLKLFGKSFTKNFYDFRMLSSLNFQTVSKGNDGANDGARTRDIQDHNLALYQLSYIRRNEG